MRRLQNVNRDKAWDERKLNRRSIYLHMKKKLWLLPALLLAGALLAGGIYTVYKNLMGTENYQQISKLRITFSVDEAGNAADYYNGATWTDLLTADPRIEDKIIAGLAAAGVQADERSAYRDLIRNSVRADILSDVRLMTVTVHAHTPELAGALTEAVDYALVAFGKEAEEFREITILTADPVERVYLQDRTRNALLLGGFLGLLTGMFLLRLLVLLDDRIYVPEDCRVRCGIPVIGCLTGRKADASGKQQSSMEKKLRKEFMDNILFLGEKAEKPLALVSPEGREKAEELLAEWKIAEELKPLFPEGKEKLLAFGPEDYDGIRKMEGILMALSFGKDRGSAVEHYLQQLEIQECHVRGILLAEADMRFLSSYYRGAE